MFSRKYNCTSCNFSWKVPFRHLTVHCCPKCGSSQIIKAKEVYINVNKNNSRNEIQKTV